MIWIKRVLWATLCIALLVVAGYVYVQDSRAKKLRTLQEAIAQDTAEFAKCAGMTLSSKGLQDWVIHQYKPAGIQWQSMNEFMKSKGLLGFDPPTGRRLTNFERQNIDFDWEPITSLIKKCQPKLGPPFDAGYRNSFWIELEGQPEFQKAVSIVKERDDAILEPLRKEEKRRLAAAAQDVKTRDSELFRDEKLNR